LPVLDDGALFAIDARFEVAIHRIEEIVAIELRLESQDAAAESPSSSSARQGQMPRRSEFGHGMCQKVMMVARGRRSRMRRGARAKW
jgi:hypothetical protein